MGKRVIFGCLLVVILIPLSLAVAGPTGTKKANAKSTTTFVMEWSQAFGGAEFENAFSLLQSPDGGFALAGWTYSYGAGGADFWLVKTDANGQAEWNQTFGGAEEDCAYSMIQTADGGYALVGGTGSYGAGQGDMWLVKTDANGQAEWNQTFGGAEGDNARLIIQTADGGYALVGGTGSYGAGQRDMWLVKTDANGIAQWNQTYGGPEEDVADSVLQTADGGYVVAGWTESYGAGQYDMWLVKTDANGQAVWNQTYGGTEEDSGGHITQTVDGGYALAGGTDSYGASAGDQDIEMWLVKTDASGQAEWNKTLGGSVHWGFPPLIQTMDGGYALAGDAELEPQLDILVVKTDANGQEEWHHTFGGIQTDVAYSLIQTADGGYALAGNTGLFPYMDMWLIKISESEDTTTTTTDTATSETSPVWTLIIVLTSLTALLIFRKRKKHRQANKSYNIM